MAESRLFENSFPFQSSSDKHIDHYYWAIVHDENPAADKEVIYHAVLYTITILPTN